MKAHALCSYKAENPEQLSFEKDQKIIEVKKSNDKGWYIGTNVQTKETGLFHEKHVSFTEQDNLHSPAVKKTSFTSDSNFQEISQLKSELFYPGDKSSIPDLKKKSTTGSTTNLKSTKVLSMHSPKEKALIEDAFIIREDPNSKIEAVAKSGNPLVGKRSLVLESQNNIQPKSFPQKTFSPTLNLVSKSFVSDNNKLLVPVKIEKFSSEPVLLAKKPSVSRPLKHVKSLKSKAHKPTPNNPRSSSYKRNSISGTSSRNTTPLILNDIPVNTKTLIDGSKRSNTFEQNKKEESPNSEFISVISELKRAKPSINYNSKPKNLNTVSKLESPPPVFSPNKLTPFSKKPSVDYSIKPKDLSNIKNPNENKDSIARNPKTQTQSVDHSLNPKNVNPAKSTSPLPNETTEKKLEKPPVNPSSKPKSLNNSKGPKENSENAAKSIKNEKPP
ncbi:hypothetical protein BB560_006617, partial [Smittium megazygosporum]